MPLQTVAFPVDEYNALAEVVSRVGCSQSEAFRLGLQALQVVSSHTLHHALKVARELKQGRSRRGELARARLRTSISYLEAEHPLIEAAVERVRTLTGCPIIQTSHLFRLGVQVLMILDQTQLEELDAKLVRRKSGRQQQSKKVTPLPPHEVRRLFRQ